MLPGGWLRIRKDVVDGGMYWKANENKIANPEQKLRGWVEGAVASQRMADVPIACFLSGGIDSSIVATMLQKAASGSGGGAIQTVSVGFQESAFDETPYAEAVAKKIGSKHTRLEVNAGSDVMETLRMLMAKSLGQPFADSSILPTYHLSKAVQELAPVALSGDGADELFGGYDRYRAIQLLMKSPKFLTRLAPQSLPVGSMQKREQRTGALPRRHGQQGCFKSTRGWWKFFRRNWRRKFWAGPSWSMRRCPRSTAKRRTSVPCATP